MMHKLRVSSVILCILLSRTSEALAPKRTDTRARDVVDSSQNGSGDSAVGRIVGGDVKTRPYDPMLYEGSSGGPVKTGDDLECKSGQACCWANGDTSSGAVLKWQSAKGNVDSSKFQSNFNSQKIPEENYLLALSDSQHGAKDKAVFESCSIACADGDVEVQFRYWTTAGVKLEMCTRSAFFGDTDKMNNCRDVQNSKQPGLAKVTVPGGQLLTLDLVASSFTSDTGSAAIVDHITVNFKSCQVGSNSGRPTTRPSTPTVPATTTTTTTKPQQITTIAPVNDDAANCQALHCTFERDSLCGFREYKLIRASALLSTKGFAVRRGQFENLLTGVMPPKDNGAYAAAYLFPQDSATLQSDLVKISEPRILRLNAYFAAQGIRIKVCLDTESNCPLITSNDIVASDRKKWRQFNVLLPKGTKQVFIIAENTMTNQGAVAIDNIELLRPVTGGPLDAERNEGSACNGIRRN